MIGTRHEKIAIALAAYVIGFTTAFIAFGINNMDREEHMHEWKAREHFENSKHAVNYKSADANISGIFTDDSGLYVTVGGYKRILSAKQNTLATSVVQSTPTPGFHVAIQQQQVSPDGWYAFYCEQLEVNATTCDPYVYSLFDDTVYKVTTNDVADSVAIENLSVSWTSDNRLVVNNSDAKNAGQPWKLEDQTVTAEAKDLMNDIQVQ